MLLFIHFILCVLQVLALSNEGKMTYKAASVMLYDFRTAEEFANHIDNAGKQGVEIIVFPELSISVDPNLAEVISLNSTPCEDTSGAIPIQKTISCAAKKNNMYVTLGLLEKGEICNDTSQQCVNGHRIYNSAAIISRTGEIIAVYRKTHVLLPFLTAGTGDPVTFDTEFGKFGMFICFDILYQNPGDVLARKMGVRNYVYPTFWIDTSFCYARQMQQSWSEFYQSNFIGADNIHTNWSSGCGIYSKGISLGTNTQYSQDELIIADLPIFSEPSPIPKLSISQPEMIPMYNEINFQTSSSSGEIKVLNLESDVHKCQLMYKTSSSSSSSSSSEYYKFFITRISIGSTTTTTTTTTEEKQKNGYNPFSMKEDVCGVIECPSLEATVEECANHTKTKITTIFEELSLTMTVFDNIREVLPLLSTTNKNVFQGNEFQILHDYNLHTIQSTENLNNKPVKMAILDAILYDQ